LPSEVDVCKAGYSLYSLDCFGIKAETEGEVRKAEEIAERYLLRMAD
jgi:hypothetical protein